MQKRKKNQNKKRNQNEKKKDIGIKIRVFRDKKTISENGLIYVQSTYNNTIITPTDLEGNAYAVWGTGILAFKNAQKSTPAAITKVASELFSQLYSCGLRKVDVLCKGPGYGNMLVLKALEQARLKIFSISNITPVPHNGCRPKKKRRV